MTEIEPPPAGQPGPDQPAVGAHLAGHDGDPLSYDDALEELEDLLDDLEGAEVDVDLLADRVARGVALIRHCRARLEIVTSDVDAVVAELVTIDAQTDSEAEAEDDGDFGTGAGTGTGTGSEFDGDR